MARDYTRLQQVEELTPRTLVVVEKSLETIVR
jgi:hypothetical protein